MRKQKSKFQRIVINILALITTTIVVLTVALILYFSKMGFYGNSVNSIYNDFCGNITDNYVVKALYEAKERNFQKEWYHLITDELGLECRVERHYDDSEEVYVKYQSPDFQMDRTVRYHTVGPSYYCYYSIDDYWKCISRRGVCGLDKITDINSKGYDYQSTPNELSIVDNSSAGIVVSEDFYISIVSEAEIKEPIYFVFFNVPTIEEVQGTILEDYYNRAYTMARLVSFFIQYGVTIMIVSLILMLFSLGYLASSSGYSNKHNGIHLLVLDRIPSFICLIAFMMMGYGWWRVFVTVARIQFDMFNHILLFVCMSLILSALIISLVHTVSVRVKNKTLIPFTMRLINSVKHTKLKVVLYALILWLVSLMIEALIIIFLFKSRNVKAYIGIGIFKVIELILLLTYAGQYGRIYRGTDEIAGGDLNSSIDTSHMFSYLKRHAENINNINHVVSEAVEDKLKSEKMRTELITNVSHDIKTPLTSVINYTDLISKEPSDNPKIYEYCTVLSRQSIKLKKLIEDLIEASKASTGNIEMHIAPVDVAVILSQALGEFDDRITASGLETVVNKRFDGRIRAEADSRYLWRVFDNLLTNICKYSLKGTRVYIDLEENTSDNTVSIIFKNISSTKLNMSSTELLERFARGDSSRNTEGSGLGLPIAQSLIVLMNGKLNLTIDGDLFRAEVILNKEQPVLQSESAVSESNSNSEQIATEEFKDSNNISRSKKRRNKRKDGIRKNESME